MIKNKLDVDNQSVWANGVVTIETVTVSFIIKSRFKWFGRQID